MFIELTNLDGLPISVNKNKIVTFWKTNDGCGIDTEIHNFSECIFVKEKYEEVLEKINS